LKSRLLKQKAFYKQLCSTHKCNTTLPEFKEHIIISPDSALFNKQGGEIAYKDLIKILRQKKMIGNSINDSQSIEIDSYDATDSCYRFRVVSPLTTEYQGSSILGCWEYFPKTKKVVNGITLKAHSTSVVKAPNSDRGVDVKTTITKIRFKN